MSEESKYQINEHEGRERSTSTVAEILQIFQDVYSSIVAETSTMRHVPSHLTFVEMSEKEYTPPSATTKKCVAPSNFSLFRLFPFL